MNEYAGWDYMGADADVGHWFWPLAFGVPAGVLGGYYYRKWQEKHPGKIIPWISGPAGFDAYDASVGAYDYDANVGAYDYDASVGAYDYDASVGGPWVDIVGAAVDSDVARRRAWPQTRALIQSAISEVLETAAMAPAVAYVWSLDPPGPSPRPGVELTGTTMIVPFTSREQALSYMRDRIQTPHVALALFDRTSPRWPNPMNWTKSDRPEHEPAIAQQIAKYAPTRAAGEAVGAWPWWTITGEDVDASVGAWPWWTITGEDVDASVGAVPWYTIVGQAIDILRRQAKAAAEEMPGLVIGLRRDAYNRWTLKSFRSVDDADDWFGRAIAEPRDFTYAAYFSKDRHGIPFLENEQIGGARAPSVPGRPIPREIATVTVSP